MGQRTPPFTLGIEEEYLLVDLETRQLAREPPEALFRACARCLPNQVTHEFLRSQIEVGTPVCRSIGETREALLDLRLRVARIAERFGLGIIAASSHPFAFWSDQRQTPKDRYRMLADSLQGVVRRLVTCGMHVHVGIDDADTRIELMNRCVYFLPYLLALSTSSPYWGGDDTGLKSYRLAVFNELPRTGLPDAFEDHAEYQRQVGVLTDAGLIKDASMLWWDLRPSTRFPTLEMRITDVCTHFEDSLCIAALYQATLLSLYRSMSQGPAWRRHSPMLTQENRWRAQRYGIEADLVDLEQQGRQPFSRLLEEWLAFIDEAADSLGCTREVAQARRILERGTSADQQRQHYRRAREAGRDHHQALQQVVDWLLATTTSGVSTAPYVKSM